MEWHGYVLIERPAALTAGQWRTVLLALYRVLNRRADHPLPSHRLHYRLSLDRNAVILEADFEDQDLDVEDLQRLPRYVSEALDGAFTPAQCRQGLRGHVTLFGARRPWSESLSGVHGYLRANGAEWEEDVTDG